jgi:hypothetical protein
MTQNRAFPYYQNKIKQFPIKGDLKLSPFEKNALFTAKYFVVDTKCIRVHMKFNCPIGAVENIN